MSNPAQVTILAEDRRQARFVRSYLRRKRPDLAQSVIKDAPMSSGRGSGAQWVINRYSAEIEAYCARHAKKWLIVVIDADAKSVQDRINELSKQLLDSEDERLRKLTVETEAIARLVPKWSIETWILSLNGEAVDEETPYKRLGRQWDDLIRRGAIELHICVNSNADFHPGMTPSLGRGIRELRHLSTFSV